MNLLIKRVTRQKMLMGVVLLLIFTGCRQEDAKQLPSVDKPYGVVSVSVCNMRPEPAHNTELVSQAVMGTPVMITDIQQGWYYVQTPEPYEGWVDKQAIEAMNISEIEEWRRSDRLIYLKKTGDIYADSLWLEPLSDIVAGSVVRLMHEGKDYYFIGTPDGREGYLRKNNVAPLNEWLSNVRPEEESLKTCAESFMGIPYLWGGTSSKAFDCSGFVKTIYYMHGIILARDASQQFKYGTRIGKEAYPDSLRPGDLMFFGYERDGDVHPTHVGMYTGDNEFIHASGRVKVNSLDSTRSNFSKGRRDSFLGVRRIIGAEPGEGIQYISAHPWYNDKP
ncbi:MAG: NlpC/P60 family protein [Bacteroidota bacterium]